MANTSIVQEKYISFTTYRKDGTPKPVPVWPVDAGGGKVGFITSSKTWKVKRALANPDVTLRASDAKGRVKEGTQVYSGTAEVLSGAAFERIEKNVKKKYGIQLWLIDLLHALPGARGGYPSDRAVIVTLDD